MMNHKNKCFTQASDLSEPKFWKILPKIALTLSINGGVAFTYMYTKTEYNLH